MLEHSTYSRVEGDYLVYRRVYRTVKGGEI